MQSYLKLWSRPRRDYYVATKEDQWYRNLYKKGRQFDTDRRSQMIQWRALGPLDGRLSVRHRLPQMPLYGTVLAWVHERILVKLDLGKCISTRKSWKMITTSELIEISWLYNTVDRKLHGHIMIPTHSSRSRIIAKSTTGGDENVAYTTSIPLRYFPLGDGKRQRPNPPIKLPERSEAKHPGN